MGFWLLALVFLVSGVFSLKRAASEAHSDSPKAASSRNRAVLGGVMVVLGLLVACYAALSAAGV